MKDNTNLRYKKYNYYKKSNRIKKRLGKVTAFFAVSVILLAVTIIYVLSSSNIDESKSMSLPDVSYEEKTYNTEENTNKPLMDGNIRVVIKTSDFKGIFHENVKVSSKTGMDIYTDDGSIYIKTNPDEIIDFAQNEQLKDFSGVIHVKTNNDALYLNSVERSCGYPAYYGFFDIYNENDGYVVVNEVDMEKYLYGVVPSEMPDSYGLEALKAQAVCARSYAGRRMNSIAYPNYNAAVDDSVRYQVYNNYEITEKIKEAVDCTKDEVVVYNGEIIDAYFYAASCGISAGAEVWSEEGKNMEYLDSVELSKASNEKKDISSENDFEKFISVCDENNYDCNSSWYRWQIKLDVDLLESDWTEKYGEFQKIEVVSRSRGGIITKLNVVGSKDVMHLSSEYDIREFLGRLFINGENQNGEIKQTNMLPSACFYVDCIKKNIITIKGGGYGHGVGMSQTAANAMSADGMKYNEILQMFYPGTSVVKE